jgi:hypothetical protein
MTKLMTKLDLLEHLKQYPDDTVLFAFDGDQGETVPVTGLLYIPGAPGQSGALEFCTFCTD